MIDFPVTPLVAVIAVIFFHSKSPTFSYGDSCFWILEVCHFFFKVYYMWRGTGIRDKCFAAMMLVWRFCDKYFVVYYVLCDVVCRLFFRLFLHVAILFFVIVHFEIIVFLLVIFVFVVLLFFLSDYLPTVFIDMSRFVAAMSFWYIPTFFMPAVFFLVTVFPAWCAGTLVLGFYVDGFSSSLEVIVLDCLFVQSNSIKSLLRIL